MRYHLIASEGPLVSGIDTDITTEVWDSSLSLRAIDSLQTLNGGGPSQPWPQMLPSVDCDGTRFAVATASCSAAPAVTTT